MFQLLTLLAILLQLLLESRDSLKRSRLLHGRLRALPRNFTANLDLILSQNRCVSRRASHWELNETHTERFFFLLLYILVLFFQIKTPKSYERYWMSHVVIHQYTGNYIYVTSPYPHIHDNSLMLFFLLILTYSFFSSARVSLAHCTSETQHTMRSFNVDVDSYIRAHVISCCMHVERTRKVEKHRRQKSSVSEQVWKISLISTAALICLTPSNEVMFDIDMSDN